MARAEVDTQPARGGGLPTFGALVRQYRQAAALSQAALAERAGLSTDAVSVIERGKRGTPRPDTVAQLARALDLAPTERAAFIAAGGPTAPAPAAMPAGAALEPHEAPPHGTAPLADLPTGTLTFLLTDIEDSTPLWERQPSAMRAAIVRHDALFDELLVRHGGRQIKERGEGDSIFAVFPSPSAALAAACALQRALLAEPWPPETPLRVRMGLHTGEANPRDGGYYGAAVNRAARIRSLAHGGQVLLSQALRDLVRDTPPEGLSLRSLGVHGLKGLQHPDEVYQLLHRDLPAEFPPLLSQQVPTTNLPVQETSFVGWEREQREVKSLLERSHLVTLTGAGGAGKTRLLLQVAAASVETAPDGVWLVELAPLTDSALVPQAVAAVVGVREEPGRTLTATLVATLRARALLLLLDNCEHLIAACAEVATALLRACPHLRILASSREALAVAGETTYQVPALSVPDLIGLPDPEQLAGYESVQLFLERAQARRPEFGLTAKNARAVAEICARLDGLPLAIELAAARVGVLPVEGIAIRLDDRIRLLTGGPRTALPRQQTLRATLDWSHDLLREPEQVLLRRLSVFAGGWALEAAEVVCAGEGVAAWEVLDLLGGLIHKSLILLDEAEGDARYRLLETVRQYGSEKLAASGEEAAVRGQHLRWYLALAEEAEPALTGQKQEVWLARLEREHDNLRSALGWWLVPGTADPAPHLAEVLRLATALWTYWHEQGCWTEGRAWLTRGLAAQGTVAPPVRAKALLAAGMATLFQGDYEVAMALLEESLALFSAVGSRHGCASALTLLGYIAAYELNRERVQGIAAEAMALRPQLTHRPTIAYLTTFLGLAAGIDGDLERGITLEEEALTLFREFHDNRGMRLSLAYLGFFTATGGDQGRARELLVEGLQLSRQSRDALATQYCLFGLAKVASVEGQSARAAQLWGASENLRQVQGLHLSFLARARMDYDRDVATAGAQLGQAAFAEAWQAGRAMTLVQAIALALEDDAAG